MFHQVPEAVARWMPMHLQRYLKLCEELEKDPDMELIGPQIELLQQLDEREAR